MQIEILPHGKLAVERECLRHVADILTCLMSSAPIGFPNNLAEPSVTGSSPVIIFMVVVFPQPFEAEESDKSPPRPHAKAHMVKPATKSPNRRVSPICLDCRRLVIALGAWPHDDLLCWPRFSGGSSAMKASSSVLFFAGQGFPSARQCAMTLHHHRGKPIEPARLRPYTPLRQSRS